VRTATPAFVRVASQAAKGSLRGDTDDGMAAAFDLDANVKLQGASPWPLTKKPAIAQHSQFDRRISPRTLAGN